MVSVKQQQQNVSNWSQKLLNLHHIQTKSRNKAVNSESDLQSIFLSSYLSLNLEGHWGTTDDFATSFLHFSLFSTALWDLENSRPVHSLMLASHLFLCLPCLLPPFLVPLQDGLTKAYFRSQLMKYAFAEHMTPHSGCLKTMKEVREKENQTWERQTDKQRVPNDTVRFGDLDVNPQRRSTADGGLCEAREISHVLRVVDFWYLPSHTHLQHILRRSIFW